MPKFGRELSNKIYAWSSICMVIIPVPGSVESCCQCAQRRMSPREELNVDSIWSHRLAGLHATSNLHLQFAL